MPKDDQDYLGSVLSSIPIDFSKLYRNVGDYSNDIADRIERNFNDAAVSIRKAASGTDWIPSSIKPAPQPPPPRHVAAVPVGYLERVQSWVDRNRALTAAIIAFLGTGTFLLWRQRHMVPRRRRARRTTKGAKTELVVLAGSPYSPMTRSLALDLEHRGFIVYIPVGSLEEEGAVAELRAPDIHSLNFDITSNDSVAEMRDKLSQYLINPQRHGTTRLHLASLILLDSCPSTHPTGTIENLPPSTWSVSLNTHILYPISLAHAFLPVLISEFASTPLPTSSSKPPPPTTIILLTLSIPSLHLPNHGPESLATAALTSWFTTLRRELPAPLSLAHLQLGGALSTDLAPSAISASSTEDQLVVSRTARYGSASPSQSSSSSSPAGRKLGSKSAAHKSAALVELHEGVFDAVVGRRTGVVYVGRGARTYALVGAWVPHGLVGRMMGHRSTMGNGKEGRRERRSSDGSGIASTEWEKVEGLEYLGQPVKDGDFAHEHALDHDST